MSIEWDERGGATVWSHGHPQSYVDLHDPGLLGFEYHQHLAIVIDSLEPLPPHPLRVTHVGGAGLTLPRYLQHTRPRSPQIVLEPDEELTELIRTELPLPRGHRIRVRPINGQEGMAAIKDDSADVLVVDAFADGCIPLELTTSSFLRHLPRVLGPAGVVAFNIADERGMKWCAQFVTTLRQTFPHVCLIAMHEVLKAKRYGNVVVVASLTDLPEDALARRVASAAVPTGHWSSARVAKWASQAQPLPAAGLSAPPPPDAGTWRIR